MNTDEASRHFPSLAPGPRGPLKQPFMTLIKPKKSSSACIPCKLAKRKCTGRPSPCKACQNTDADCIFDETLDLRRKIAAQRTLGEMEHYRGLLHSLIEILRSADEERVQHTLQTIRDSSSLSPIAAAVDSRAINVGNTTAEVISDTLDGDEVVQQAQLSADPQSRITLEKLCDIPLFRVPAKPWTKVTEDDHLVSHLISLYFTWDHPLSQLFDQTLFLDHMTTQDTASEFCSPLLVNSILAVASSYSDFPELFTVPGDATSKGLHFYTEAERLWKAEEGQISLPNIQALCLMSYLLEGYGKLQTSWMMLRQAVQLAQDFGIFQGPRTRGQGWEDANVSLKCVGLTTASAIFMVNSQMSMERGRASNLPLPRPVLSIGQNPIDNILWHPYPRSTQNRYGTVLLPYTQSVMMSLSRISIDIQDLLFDKALDMKFDEVQLAVTEIYSCIEKWYEGLSGIFQADEESTPQTLFIRIRYHHIIINLFELLLSLEDGNPTFNPSIFEEAKLAQIHSAKQIALFLCRHREIHGLREISGQMLGATNSSALILLAILSQDETIDAFVEVCRTLVAFSRRLRRAKSMLDNIESVARRSGINLPSEAIAVLNHTGLVSSQWL